MGYMRGSQGSARFGGEQLLLASSVCGFGTIAPGIVPISHTVEPSVCDFGTIAPGIVPISHTVEPSVCGFGTVAPGIVL